MNFTTDYEMKYTAYTKENGEAITLPKGFYLEINETSIGVYLLNILDCLGRSVTKHNTDLDHMFDEALSELLKWQDQGQI